MQQISCAVRINKDSVYIKIVNTQGKYKCIIMRSVTLVGFISGKDMAPSTG